MKTAIVIDDDSIVLMGLRAFLTTAGYEVVAAESGEAALAMIRAGDLKADIVLADYRLRGDETGVSVINAIRKEFGSFIPAIILTGETGETAVAEAAAEGIGVLHKPVAPSELTMIVEKLTKYRHPGG